MGSMPSAPDSGEAPSSDGADDSSSPPGDAVFQPHLPRRSLSRMADGSSTLEAAHNAESVDLPGAYFVRGAGLPEANGWYARDGTYSGAPVYKRGLLWLYRHTCQCDTCNGARSWYISDRRVLPSDAHGDFYKAPARDCCEADAMLPPTEPELWTACHEHCEPCPSSVSRVDDREGPVGFIVALAGDASADGAYVRCGSFAAAPLFKQLDEARPDGFGAHFLLAYQLPSGRRRWYVAEKDTLDVDQGDKYYADSDADLPPTDPSAWRVARSGAPGAPLTRAVFEGEDDFFDRRFRSLNAGAKKRHERIKNEHTIETWEVRAEAEREKRGRSFEGASTSGPTTPGGACDALARLCVGDDAAGGGEERVGRVAAVPISLEGVEETAAVEDAGVARGVPVLVPGTFVGRPAGEGRDEGDGSGRDVPVYTVYV